MADIEKVKDGLKIHSTAYTCTEKCPYYNPGEYGCADTLTADALTIIEELQAEIERLKAQPTIIETDSFKYVFPKKDGDGK